MPNRILRDWTDSFTINELSIEAERLFTRLIMKADDFGRFHGDPRLVLAACFPLLPSICLADVEQWLSECAKSGCITIYTCERGHKFIKINNFRQQTRSKSSKFPDPATQVHSKRVASAHLDVVGDVVGDGDGDGCSGTESLSQVSGSPGSASATSKARGSMEELKSYAREIGLPESDGEYLFNSWESGGWLRGSKKIKDWQAAMRAWKSGGYMPSQKNGGSGKFGTAGGAGSEDDIAAKYGS